MKLVDTSIWIDHFHAAEPALVDLLEMHEVACHPMVIGELALGSLRDRETTLELLANLPATSIAEHDEVMKLVSARELYGRGLGLVDAHLLASTLMTPGARIWTRDKRLRVAADELGVGWHSRR